MTVDGPLGDLLRAGRYGEVFATLAGDPVDPEAPDRAWFARRRIERRLALRAGDSSKAREIACRVAAKAEATGGAALGGALVDLACHEPSGPALATLARAEALARAEGARDLSFDVHMAAFAVALETHDRIAQREALARAAEAVPDAPQRSDYLIARAHALTESDPAEAIRWAELSAEHAADPYPVAEAYSLAANVCLGGGRVDDAMRYADRALAAAERIDTPVDQHGAVYIVRAIACLTTGDLDTAGRNADTALARYPARSRRRYGVKVLRAALDALRGDPSGALRTIAELEPTDWVSARARAAAVELLVACDTADPRRFDRAYAGAIVDGRLRVVEPPLPLLVEHAARRAERHRASDWIERATRLHAALLRNRPPGRLAGAETRGRDRTVRALRRLGERGVRAQVGPLSLVRPLASGGFGDVYEARTERGLSVALKTIRTRPGAAEMLVNELRAVAALDHPNVVQPVLHGVVDAVAHAMEPRLVPGTPWIATELARGGTLAERAGAMRWDEVRAVLVGLLDALAHAHARGLLHLDIKPQNVLQSDDGVRLVDFGLAASSVREQDAVAGTAEYLAPERFRQDWREVGPWTDLYAVGCLAVTLVSGAPPFRGTTLDEVRSGHLVRQPRLAPVIPVPGGFEGWVLRLLAKEPAERFRRAADAGRALLGLGPVDEAEGSEPVGCEDLPTVVLPAAATGADLPRTQDRIAPGVRCPVPPPHVPADWRRREPHRPASDHAASLGLFGLRVARFVGREREREALWRRLRQVATSGTADAIGIEAGAEGLGTSALAAWLCERALELGAAHVLTFDGAPGEPAGASVRRAFVERWRCGGLTAAPLAAHLARVAAPDGVSAGDAPGLAAFLEASPDPDEAARAIGRLASTGPTIVRVERPGSDPVALEVAERLATQAAPVLVVVAGPWPGHSALALGPLDPDESRALVQALLPLAPEPEDALIAAAQGSPAYVVHALTHLVHRERLEPGPDGWRVRAPREPLPPSPGALWEARVRWVADALSPGARAAAVVAARLGPVLGVSVWEEACAALAIDGRAEAEARLFEARLVVRHPIGLAFANAGIRRAWLGGA